jgi:transcriptional regulator with XRE-family HTH domain
LKSADELQLETIDNFYKQIGFNVKEQRTKKGYTQLQLSQALGHKSVGLVSQAELYLKKQHFNLEHVYKIAFILECDIYDLIPRTVVQ